MTRGTTAFLACAIAFGQTAVAHLQVRAQQPPAQLAPSGAATALPPDYVIGPDDVLDVRFWKDQDMSGEVVVRPDGRISLPLLNDVPAAGLTPDQLRARLTDEARRYVESPNATVIVKTINSRKVFITGQVEKPGPYPLTSRVTVVQLIAMAGGLREYAEAEKIVIMRSESGRVTPLKFDYTKLTEGKNVSQNIELRPGDTVIVP
jgi:polysaccharide export outer membrane protein